jgi:hypothetical protein
MPENEVQEGTEEGQTETQKTEENSSRGPKCPGCGEYHQEDASGDKINISTTIEVTPPSACEKSQALTDEISAILLKHKPSAVVGFNVFTQFAAHAAASMGEGELVLVNKLLALFTSAYHDAKKTQTNDLGNFLEQMLGSIKAVVLKREGSEG